MSARQITQDKASTNPEIGIDENRVGRLQIDTSIGRLSYLRSRA